MGAAQFSECGRDRILARDTGRRKTEGKMLPAYHVSDTPAIVDFGPHLRLVVQEHVFDGPRLD